MTNTTFNLKRVFSIAFLIVLFISMFCGWIGLTRSNMAIIKEEYGSKREILEGLRDSVENSIYETQYYSNSVFEDHKIEKSGRTLGNCVKNLSLSPSENGKFFSAFKYMLSVEDSSFENYDSIAMFGRLATASYILFYLTILSIIVSLFFILTNKGNGAYLHIFFAVTCLIGTLIAVAQINGYLMEYYDKNIISITAWPIIAVLCSVASGLLYKTSSNEISAEVNQNGGINEMVAAFSQIAQKGADIAQKSVAATKAGIESAKQRAQKPWKCPDCGTVCNGDADFCHICGTKKPEPRVCQNCGAMINEGAQFCAKCGTKYEKISFCGFCGKKLLNDERCECIKNAPILDGEQQNGSINNSENNA